jgi:LmbE family N-acetylglucosaminyl deacetylase
MRILIVAGHPDDEALGCGGTLAAHVERGDVVDILFLSEGVTSRSEPGKQKDWSDEINHREDLALKASKIFGCNLPKFLRHPNLRMRDLPMLDIVKQVDEVIRERQPEVVYTHHVGDMNSDHAVTAEAVLTACRPRPDLSVSTILAFEVPSSTEWSSPAVAPPFNPTYFVDISRHMEKKLIALKCYDFEMRSFPHPRSERGIKALAEYRGSMVGKEFVEAYVVVRSIVSLD